MSAGRPPILLLKTKSTEDSYAEVLEDAGFHPIFLPVLKHTITRNAEQVLSNLFTNGGQATERYGGLIFTSQRAVEALEYVLDKLRKEGGGSSVSNLEAIQLTFFVVGPATEKALQSVVKTHLPSVRIEGAHTGNGEALAQYILENYETPVVHPRRPLLFLVGDKRRDIIPRMLMGIDTTLSETEKIQVVEEVVYETTESEEFADALKSVLKAFSRESQPVQRRPWVVIFSPTGCATLLEALHKHGSLSEIPAHRAILICSIGPTTRDYLASKLSFEVNACAEKPSPEGVLAAIQKCISENP